MKRIGQNFGFLLLFLVAVSCGKKEYEPLSQEEKTAFLILGDSISGEAQKTLLQNVSKAMQAGGPEYAVDFCHLEAMPLTDSISLKHGVSIRRLTDKNRNPENRIRTDDDKEAWEYIKAEKNEFIRQDQDGSVSYYKPINIGMETCLTCHGKPGKIPAETLEIIRQKYPEDLATGYEMGDLRGMWKITMKK